MRDPPDGHVAGTAQTPDASHHHLIGRYLYGVQRCPDRPWTGVIATRLSVPVRLAWEALRAVVRMAPSNPHPGQPEGAGDDDLPLG